jgi:hypothetical protein
MGLLSVFALFTPVPATTQQASVGQTSWLSKMLGVATSLGLSATDWNSGGVARTIMTVMAWMFQTEDVLISQIAQGGFLDYAATGTVTYVNSNGQSVTIPVTLDPSTNPGAPPGLLDALADSVYDVQRYGAAGGSGTEVITNTGASSPTYAAGTYHVANPSNGLTYSNKASLTISPASVVGTSVTAVSGTSPVIVTTATAHGLSTGAYVTVSGTGTGTGGVNGTWQVVVLSTTQFIATGSTSAGAAGAGGKVYLAQGVAFQADVAGPGVSAPGTITTAVTVVPGVSVTNLTAFVGTAAQSNVSLATTCRLKLAALSPNGAAAADAFFAVSAFQFLSAGGIYNPFGAFALVQAPVTRYQVIQSTALGTVQVVVANANGAVPGVVDLPVTGASGSPISVSTSTAHGLSSGNVATILGVQGNTAANGTWQITVTGSNTFTIPVNSNGSYTQGGVVEGGDLGEIDNLIQNNIVPNAVTETTISATPVTVNVQATVYVTASYAGQVQAAVAAALTAYASTFAIGGITLPGEGSNVLSYDAVLGIIEASLPNAPLLTVQRVAGVPQLTLNGGTSDVAMGTYGVLSFSTIGPLVTIGV